MKKRIYDHKNAQRGKFKSKKRQYKEHAHQVAIFDLAAMYETQIPELSLLTGSLTGVNLDAQVAKRAKRAGVKPGFPDIHWPIARGQWFSLYIELKTDEGSASPIQLRVAQMLRNEGSLVRFVRGSELAWDLLMKYYKLPPLKLLKKGKSPDEKTETQLPDSGPQVHLPVPSGSAGGSPENGI